MNESDIGRSGEEPEEGSLLYELFIGVRRRHRVFLDSLGPFPHGASMAVEDLRREVPNE